jgi:hypothetical protein
MPKTMLMKLACLVFLNLGAIPAAIAATLDSPEQAASKNGKDVSAGVTVVPSKESTRPVQTGISAAASAAADAIHQDAQAAPSVRSSMIAPSQGPEAVPKSDEATSGPAETGQSAASTAISVPNIVSVDQQASQRIGEARADTSSASKAVAEPPVDRSQQFAVMSPPQKSVPANTAAAPTVGMDRRIAIILTRPDIKDISDLSSKNIAIDGKQSAWRGNVQSALVAAGASEVELTEGETKALDRLFGGEVPAAVLAVLSPAAAKNFPDFGGFKIFKVPCATD